MKKKISLLLAIVMIITLLPMSVFAKAEYRTDRTPSVADDEVFDSSYAGAVPNLIIKLKDVVPSTSTTTQAVVSEALTFRLSLENAEWEDDDGYLINIGTGAQVTSSRTNYSTTLSGNAFDVRRVSVTVLELTYTGPGPMAIDTEIYVPMHSRITDSGDVTVTIDPRESILSSGTYTYAVAGSGDTKTSVSKVSDMHDAVTELETIIIDEIRPKTIKSGTITLKAPTGFIFVDGPSDVAFSGGLSSNSWGGGYRISTDGYELYIDLTGITQSSSTRGSILIDGVTIKPEDDDTKYGDVELQISGAGTTKEKFLVAEYKEYGLVFEAENKTLPVLLSGRFEGNSVKNADADQQESAETLKVHLEENVEKSWWGGRKSEIKMPDGVKLRAVEITNAKNLTGLVGKNSYPSINSPINDVYYNDGTTTSNIGGTGASITVDNDKVSFANIYVAEDKKAEFDIKFWVSIEPGFEGDLDVTLTGPAVSEDITATVATVISPVTVEVKTTDVKIGYANVPVNDITITENEAGAILKKTYGGSSSGDYPLELWAYTTNVNLDFIGTPTFEVTEGDIVIDKVKTNGGKIEVYVKRESDKASTIVLKGVQMNIDRTVPEGPFPLRVGGKAIIANYDGGTPIMKSFFDTSHYKVQDAYSVVTAAPDKTSTLIVEAVLNLDEPNVIYISDGTVVTMADAAAYIENSRTMIPVAYIAAALGISQSNVIWDGNAKTVTIMRNNYVAQLQAGSNIIKVNGADITMDTAAVIKDGRTYIPVAYVAMALGIPYRWDAETRTVTFNPLDETVKSSAE